MSRRQLVRELQIELATAAEALVAAQAQPTVAGVFLDLADSHLAVAARLARRLREAA